MHKDDSANLNILVICSYCKRPMHSKSGGKEYVISHGCCDECFKKEVTKFDKANETKASIHGKKKT